MQSSIPKNSVAVLPFADMSEAGDQAWFAEGIAEELLIALSQVDKLNVIARTSSFAFKNTDKTVAEIADKVAEHFDQWPKGIQPTKRPWE